MDWATRSKFKNKALFGVEVHYEPEKPLVMVSL
jgi:hypothetical protein